MNIPIGNMMKKGNQHIRKTPTTIPKVLATFFSLLNFEILELTVDRTFLCFRLLPLSAISLWFTELVAVTVNTFPLIFEPVGSVLACLNVECETAILYIRIYTIDTTIAGM